MIENNAITNFNLAIAIKNNFPSKYFDKFIEKDANINIRNLSLFLISNKIPFSKINEKLKKSKFFFIKEGLDFKEQWLRYIVHDDTFEHNTVSKQCAIIYAIKNEFNNHYKALNLQQICEKYGFEITYKSNEISSILTYLLMKILLSLLF